MTALRSSPRRHRNAYRDMLWQQQITRSWAHRLGHPDLTRQFRHDDGGELVLENRTGG